VVTSEEPVPAGSAWQSATTAGLVFSVIREVPAPLDDPVEPTSDYRPANRAPSRGLDGRLFTWQPGFAYRRHSTPTLDFIIVLAGQIELLLDTESRVLGPGDVVIQRGTMHGWRVAGSEPCTFAGIFVDAKVTG
jgi:quercetin dioxygenase-like cupin family protein